MRRAALAVAVVGMVSLSMANPPRLGAKTPPSQTSGPEPPVTSLTLGVVASRPHSTDAFT
jgi:hypothetical protein